MLICDARSRLFRGVGVAATVAGAAVAASVTIGVGGTVADAAHRPSPRPEASLRAVPAAERAAVLRNAPRAGRVTHLAAYLDGSTVTLGWEDPPANTFVRVIARYRQGDTPPASPADGTSVELGSPRATTATLGALRPNTRYAAAVWTRDRAGTLSHRSITSFTTQPAPKRARRRTATVSGRVTDRAGAPLSDAVVSVVSTATFRISAKTVTGTDGHFALRAPQGQFYLTASGTDATGGSSDATGYLSDYRIVTLRPHTTSQFGLSLAPGAAVTGKVTDAAGNPIRGALVSQRTDDTYIAADAGGFLGGGYSGGYDEMSTRSAADGSYVLRGIDAQAFRICVDPSGSRSAFGYVSRCDETPLLLRGGRSQTVAPVVLQQQPRAAIVGRVTSSTSQPVQGIDVFATPVGRRTAVSGAQTGSHGRYVLDDLAAGAYRVCASTADLPSRQGDLGYASRCLVRHVRVSSGTASRADVTLRAGGALSGVIRGSDGAPVRDAFVTARGAHGRWSQGTTNGRGRFTVGSLPSGRYTVCVDATSATVRGMPTGVAGRCFHRKAHVFARQGRNRIGIDFRLPAAAAISGTVTEPGGHPVRWAAVYTDGFANAPSLSWAYASTDRRGHYSLTGLRPGDYLICAEADYVAGQTISTCPHHEYGVTRGRVTRNVDLHLPPQGDVTVRVTDSSGRPLAGIDVAALQACHAPWCDRFPAYGSLKSNVTASAVSGPRGYVHLWPLPVRDYGLCAFSYYGTTFAGAPPMGYADRCLAANFSLHVVAGKLVTRTITIPTAGEVTGTVTDAAGNPLAGVVVHVTGSAAADAAGMSSEYGNEPGEDAVTAADGTYAIRSVTPGDQQICFQPIGIKDSFGFLPQCYGGAPGAAKGTAVPVASAQVTSGVDIALSRRGKLAGTVTDETGAPVSGSDVFIFQPGHPNEALVGEPRPDGTYRTPGIEPGRYIVCFDAQHYAGQCFDDVAWAGFDGDPLPAGATVLTVNPGAVTGSVDAMLQHQ